jgi:hypothetical protein
MASASLTLGVDPARARGGEAPERYLTGVWPSPRAVAQLFGTFRRARATYDPLPTLAALPEIQMPEAGVTSAPRARGVHRHIIVGEGR